MVQNPPKLTYKRGQLLHVSLSATKSLTLNSLIEEHDVRFPDLVRRQTKHVDSAIVSIVPSQLVVLPHL